MRLLLHRWACTLCGCRGGNRLCWMCRDDIPEERDTADDDGGSYL